MFKSIEHKLSYLKAFLSEAAHCELQTLLKSLFADNTQFSGLPLGTQRSLALDTIYYFARHRHWRTTDVCSGLFLEYLQMEYAVPRDEVSEIVSRLREQVGRLFASTEQNDSVDFLRYIFTTCATSESEQDLLNEIGLGRNILVRIQSIVKAALSKSPRSDRDEVHFFAEFDSQLSDIMYECADRMRKTPWILNLYQLRYTLLESPRHLRSFFEQSDYQWLYALLLMIGSKVSVREPTLASYAIKLTKRHIKNSDSDQPPLNQIMQILEDENLVFSIPCKESRQWSLTSLAQRLTAEGFGFKFKAARKFTESQFYSFNPHYQAAAIKYLPEGEDRFVLNLLEQGSPRLSPRALTEAIAHLNSRVPKEVLTFCLEGIMKESPSPWLRSAACECIGRISDRALSKASLSEIARQDPSPRVQGTASRLLRELTEARPE